MSTWLKLSLAGAIVVVSVAVAAVSVGPGRLLARAGFSAADTRLVTGLTVTGTPANPVMYVTSSDPRQGDDITGKHLPLDTNSGVVSELVRRGGQWVRTDLVRGLPRSEHDHATNGLALDQARHRLYVAQGGMTNMGAPSARFADAPEYALSSSILAIDLSSLPRRRPYDLPTLDDERRATAHDANDPFGGDQGRNQARIVPGGPVQLYATGLRNPYDLALTRSGRLYTIDNSPAWNWGGPPAIHGGSCSNDVSERGRYVPDMLYLVEKGAYYGHPNPTRSSRNVTFNASDPQSPIDRPRPRECRYTRGARGAALATFDTSTNGLVEYTAGNFGGSLRGDLIATSFDQRIYRIDLDPSGSRVIRKTPLFKIDGFPLGVTAQPDDSVFPGTIWAADWASGDLHVYEPTDRQSAPHWETLASSGPKRQEVSYVRLGSRFYLAGGGRQQEAYDPRTDRWSTRAMLPARLDHIQAVALNNRIYYIGGLIRFPGPAANTVLIYDPETDSFTRGASMPRPRGAGGIAVHDGKIYYAGGLAHGKAVPWFDVYDPKTDSWSELPDMPAAKDHFQAQVIGSRFYAIGGRDTKIDSITAENDAFDFRSAAWVSDLAPMPTPRAGYASAVVGNEIVLLGGEGPSRAFAEVEAYKPSTDTWRELDPMPDPRHGIQAVACGGDIYVAAGGLKPYGDEPSNLHSVLVTRPTNRCPLVRAKKPMHPEAVVAFRKSVVAAGLDHPTSLEFGPDGRLYVAQQAGTISVLSLDRTRGRYSILDRQQVHEIEHIPNHDDDGSPAVRWGTLLRLTASRIGICCGFPRLTPPPAAPAVATRPSARRGEQIFRAAGCIECHTFAPARSHALTGPPLDGIGALPEADLRKAIVAPDDSIAPGYPPGRMPPDYGRSLSNQQLADLIQFLRKPPGHG
jgi:glucose/arabinose dehydrogenase